jgi:hypothetical protein
MWIIFIKSMDSSAAYSLAADLLVMIHFLAILFIVLGGLLLFRWPGIAFIHLPFAAWGAIMEVMGWICPLTPWEQRLRSAAGESGYSGGFIDHYLLPLIYPEQLTREIQMGLGLFVLLFNLAVYGWWLIRRNSKKENP